jgi:hypothetical protein
MMSNFYLIELKCSKRHNKSKNRIKLLNNSRKIISTNISTIVTRKISRVLCNNSNLANNHVKFLTNLLGMLMLCKILDKVK